jgi:three-Cys-motif partner protein
MPADKVVEARHQTQQKLELMEREWGAWCTILAQTAGKFTFCPAHLWLIDTHAGSGRHLSASDPDGEIPGTPMLAALAARAAQRKVPGVTIHVRATDINKSIADELRRRLQKVRGTPPAGVDVQVAPVDWIKAVPWVTKEIADEGHPHAGRAGARIHEHRSLWFVDPFGVEGIDHGVITGFPAGSEVIVNLDLMSTIRHAGKALKGDRQMVDLLDTVFGGRTWEPAARRAHPHQPLADAFAESFPISRWRFRKAYLLRATGSQDRAMVHLANSPAADDVFGKNIVRAFKTETMLAGTLLSKTQKDAAAKHLASLFAGLTLTTREMVSSVPWSLGQLRWICSAAAQGDYGEWNEKASMMKWFEARAAKPGLFD